jgi:hypothetical protein
MLGGDAEIWLMATRRPTYHVVPQGYLCLLLAAALALQYNLAAFSAAATYMIMIFTKASSRAFAADAATAYQKQNIDTPPRRNDGDGPRTRAEHPAVGAESDRSPTPA